VKVGGDLDGDFRPRRYDGRREPAPGAYGREIERPRCSELIEKAAALGRVRFVAEDGGGCDGRSYPSIRRPSSGSSGLMSVIMSVIPDRATVQPLHCRSTASKTRPHRSVPFARNCAGESPAGAASSLAARSSAALRVSETKTSSSDGRWSGSNRSHGRAARRSAVQLRIGQLDSITAMNTEAEDRRLRT